MHKVQTWNWWRKLINHQFGQPTMQKARTLNWSRITSPNQPTHHTQSAIMKLINKLINLANKACTKCKLITKSANISHTKCNNEIDELSIWPTNHASMKLMRNKSHQNGQHATHNVWMQVHQECEKNSHNITERAKIPAPNTQLSAMKVCNNTLVSLEVPECNTDMGVQCTSYCT